MMKRLLSLFLLILVFTLTGCGTSTAAPVTQETAVTTPAMQETSAPTAETDKTNETIQPEQQSSPAETEALNISNQTEQDTANMIRLTIGNHVIHAVLEDNPSAEELAELLKKGPITMSASNYGGFEKVCSLGHRLATNDVQTTTDAGDIMLYSGNQIVIFYGSNNWAYTRLAKVVDEEISSLRDILSGSETEVVIELADAN